MSANLDARLIAAQAFTAIQKEQENGAIENPASGVFGPHGGERNRGLAAVARFSPDVILLDL